MKTIRLLNLHCNKTDGPQKISFATNNGKLTFSHMRLYRHMFKILTRQLWNDIITMTKKILIIDDEPDITYTIKNILEDNGFKVDTFNDPILALNNYKVNFYDLVILDIKMPKINGFQLYTKLREKDPKVKICFLTATERLMKNLEKHDLNWIKQLMKITLFKSQSKFKI